MMPNIDPRQMQQMMKKMGIKQEDIDAEEVIIKCKDKRIIISNPSVQKVNMMGQKNYQISGEETEEPLEEETAEDDIQTVMDQAGCTQEEAQQALKDTEGNIAEAILLLTAEKED
jgi:nascent polypeptide-associated complex subunit alpha